MTAGAESAVVVAAAVPALALIWAGTRKLQRPFPASVALVRFGLLPRVRPEAGRAAGAVEAIAGIALLLKPIAVWAYLLPLGLLTLFMLLIARSLHRRERFSCACFGSDEGQVITGATLLRTGALLGLCAAAFVGAWHADAPTAAVDQLLIVALVSLVLATLQLVLAIRSTNPFAST